MNPQALTAYGSPPCPTFPAQLVDMGLEARDDKIGGDGTVAGRPGRPSY